MRKDQSHARSHAIDTAASSAITMTSTFPPSPVAMPTPVRPAPSTARASR
nr:hypothetical protein [Luteimicrobium xylanilyticum]